MRTRRSMEAQYVVTLNSLRGLPWHLHGIS